MVAGSLMAVLGFKITTILPLTLSLLIVVQLNKYL